MTLSCAEARILASDLIDGELDEATAAELMSHVSTCLSCPPLYRSLVLVHDSLRGLAGSQLEIEQAALARVRSAILAADA